MIDKEIILQQKIEKLRAQLNEAISDMIEAFDTDDTCSFCAHLIECPGDKSCSGYVEGRGLKDEQGKEYDWKWSCLDFEYGTCSKMMGTPCEGCNLKNHFKWRGLD